MDQANFFTAIQPFHNFQDVFTPARYTGGSVWRSRRHSLCSPKANYVSAETVLKKAGVDLTPPVRRR